MSPKLRVTLVVSIAIALAVGWWIAGPLAYEIAIGLDASAFPGGAALQRMVEWIAPGLASIGAGVGLFAAIALAVGAAAFLLVRSARRAQLGATDPSRRGFLTGFGIGSAAALAASALAAGLGFARAWLGLGRGGRGWRPVFSEIFGEAHGETHPEWMAAWRGSRVPDARPDSSAFD